MTWEERWHPLREEWVIVAAIGAEKYKISAPPSEEASS